MFRTEIMERTETNFEDSFFDDMLGGIETLRITKPNGNYDAGWNSALKNCVLKMHSFFGRKHPPAEALDIFQGTSVFGEKEERQRIMASIFNDLTEELLKARIPNPTTEDHKSWNSAVRVCLIRLCKFFGKSDELENVLAPFSEYNYPPEDESEDAPEQEEQTATLHNPVYHPSYYCEGSVQ